jgi:hypothetical protein
MGPTPGLVRSPMRNLAWRPQVSGRMGKRLHVWILLWSRGTFKKPTVQQSQISYGCVLFFEAMDRNSALRNTSPHSVCLQRVPGGI